MVLSASVKKDLHLIKKKYEIPNHYDLIQKMEHLPTEIMLMPSFTRPSEIKKQVQALIKVLKKLLDMLGKTPAQTKIDLNSTILFYEHNGFNNIRCQNKLWNMSAYEVDTYIAYKAYLFLLENIPKDPGGRTQRSITKYVIFLLIPIYHAGTGNEPTCGWVDCGDDDSSGKHVGDFYEFVLDLHPALQELGINLGKESSIGTDCVEAIAHYKNLFSNYLDLYKFISTIG